MVAAVMVVLTGAPHVSRVKHLSALRRGARARAAIVGLSIVALGAIGCDRSQGTPVPTASAQEPPPAPLEITEMIYDGALAKGWNDWGWAPRELGKGPARLHMDNNGGWIVARPGLSGSFGALTFKVRAPTSFGDFLEVSVNAGTQTVYPQVVVKAAHRSLLPDGWTLVTIPAREYNPEGLPFDRVVFRAMKKVDSTPVALDHIGFAARRADERAAPPPVRDAVVSIDCKAPAERISPLIFGIAFDARGAAQDAHTKKLGATARRWGGNPTSRYNWELGDAWNTGSDWFFENVNPFGKPGKRYAEFLNENLALGVQSALTLPMIGYVAKDTVSFSFPVAEFGPQRASDPYKPAAGDGYTKNQKPIPPGPPERTSVAAPPAMIKRWVEAIRAEDMKRGARSVSIYILDNEPMLWSSTHRDVHPDHVTYDELLDRTIRYGTAVREADPVAMIAGPALWGWQAYLYSAKDSAAGHLLRPDRRAHGDVPLLAWYLAKLREHEARTGVHILNLVDVHFYPQATGVGGDGGGVDAKASALRIRSTRALWDPTYVDESWIGEKIALIPRLKRWIAENYPGLGIAIGEYNFGAEGHISGGLALAEALGRFAVGGVSAAFYWTYPPDGSPAFWAFRAYRDFDGQGSRFLDLLAPAEAPEGLSVFASRDEDASHIVAVLLNLSPDSAVRPKLSIKTCGEIASRRVFQYTSGAAGLAAVTAGSGDAITEAPLPPYSITVLDARLRESPK